MANGKVRCGQCEHVFNAQENLYEQPPGDSSTEEQEGESSLTDAVTQAYSESAQGSTTNLFNTPGSSLPGMDIKEKMERIKASLSAATQELKNARSQASFTRTQDKPSAFQPANLFTATENSTPDFESPEVNTQETLTPDETREQDETLEETSLESQTPSETKPLETRSTQEIDSQEAASITTEAEAGLEAEFNTEAAGPANSESSELEIDVDTSALNTDYESESSTQAASANIHDELDEITRLNEKAELDELDEIAELENIQLTPEEHEIKSKPEEEELDLLDYQAEGVEPDVDLDATISEFTRKVDQDDLDILNSLMEEESKQAGYEAKSEEDSELLDELDDLNRTLANQDTLEDTLSSQGNDLSLDESLSRPDSKRSLDDTLSPLDNDRSLDEELSSIDDDLNNLDNGDDLLAELEQLEQDFNNEAKQDQKEQSAATESRSPQGQDQFNDEDTFEGLNALDGSEIDEKGATKGSKESSTSEEVVPSFLTQHEEHRTSSTALFAWLAGTLGLVALLVGQYLHVNSIQFAQNKTLRPLLETICPMTGCNLPFQKSARQIITVRHDVRTHPKINNALEIELSFKNKAPFIQDYPILEVMFSNPQGELVAQRKFLPQEYLAGNVQINQGIKPNQSQDVLLKIVDPDPSSLLSFQFNYY
jgi:hypothetical protein